jgi:hypothetical protein
VSGADCYYRKYTPEQLACRELGCDYVPHPKEIFSHYGEEIAFEQLVEEFRVKKDRAECT